MPPRPPLSAVILKDLCSSMVSNDAFCYIYCVWGRLEEGREEVDGVGCFVQESFLVGTDSMSQAAGEKRKNLAHIVWWGLVLFFKGLD